MLELPQPRCDVGDTLVLADAVVGFGGGGWGWDESCLFVGAGVLVTGEYFS